MRSVESMVSILKRETRMLLARALCVCLLGYLLFLLLSRVSLLEEQVESLLAADSQQMHPGLAETAGAYAALRAVERATRCAAPLEPSARKPEEAEEDEEDEAECAEAGEACKRGRRASGEPRSASS